MSGRSNATRGDRDSVAAGSLPDAPDRAGPDQQPQSAFFGAAVDERLEATLNKFFSTETAETRAPSRTPVAAPEVSQVRFSQVVQYLISLGNCRSQELSVRDAGLSESHAQAMHDELVRQLARVHKLGFEVEGAQLRVDRVGGFVRNRLDELLITAEKVGRKEEQRIAAFGHEVRGVFARNVYPAMPRPYLELHDEDELLLALPAVCACLKRRDDVSVRLEYPVEEARFSRVMGRRAAGKRAIDFEESEQKRWRISAIDTVTKKAAPTLLQLIVLLSAMFATVAKR